jgi:hypothetical protein
MTERLRPQFDGALDLVTPRDFHRFPPSTIDQVVDWLGRK